MRCGKGDSNPHRLPCYHLKVVRLPVSPSPRNPAKYKVFRKNFPNDKIET